MPQKAVCREGGGQLWGFATSSELQHLVITSDLHFSVFLQKLGMITPTKQ